MFINYIFKSIKLVIIPTLIVAYRDMIEYSCGCNSSILQGNPTLEGINIPPSSSTTSSAPACFFAIFYFY
jgi:hypothetical protein